MKFGFRWLDVSNVVNHKKLLSLECVTPTESVQFHFAEVDGAKKAFRTAVLQNMFFRKYEADHCSNTGQQEHATLPIFHQVSTNLEVINIYEMLGENKFIKVTIIVFFFIENLMLGRV